MQSFNYEYWKGFYNLSFEKKIEIWKTNIENIFNLKLFLGLIYYINNFNSNKLFSISSKINFYNFYKIYWEIKQLKIFKNKIKYKKICLLINDNKIIIDKFLLKIVINSNGKFDYFFYNFLKFKFSNDFNYEDYKLGNIIVSIEFSKKYCKEKIKNLKCVYYNNYDKKYIIEKLKELSLDVKFYIFYLPKKWKNQLLKLLVYLICINNKLISTLALSIFEIIYKKINLNNKCILETHNIYINKEIKIKIEKIKDCKYIEILKLIYVKEKDKYKYFYEIIDFKNKNNFELNYEDLINCKDFVVLFFNEDYKIIKEKGIKFILFDNLFEKFKLIHLNEIEKFESNNCYMRRNLILNKFFVIDKNNPLQNYENLNFVLKIENCIESMNYHRKFKKNILKIQKNNQLLVKKNKNKPILNFRDFSSWFIFLDYIKKITKKKNIKGIFLNINDYFIKLYNIDYNELLKKDDDDCFHYSKNKIKSGFIIKSKKIKKNLFYLKKALLIFLKMNLKNIQIFIKVDKFINHNLSDKNEIWYCNLNKLNVIPIFQIKNKNDNIIWYKIYLSILFKLKEFIYVIYLNKIYKIIPKNIFVSFNISNQIEKNNYLINCNDFKMIFNIHNNTKNYITLLGFKTKSCKFFIFFSKNKKDNSNQMLLHFNLILDLKYTWNYIKNNYSIFEYIVKYKSNNKEYNMIEFFNNHYFILDNIFYKEDYVQKVKIKFKKINLKRIIKILEQSVKKFLTYNLKENCYFIKLFKLTIINIDEKNIFLFILHLFKKKNLDYKRINQIIKLFLPKYQKLFISKIKYLDYNLLKNLKKINTLNNIVILTTEFNNIINVGGLAVMLESLVFDLIEYDIDINVIIPEFIEIKDSIKKEFEFVQDFEIIMDRNYKITVNKFKMNSKINIYFIKEKNLFRKIYSYSNNYNLVQQVTLFNKGALKLIEFLNLTPNIILTNDWYCSLFSFYLRKNNKIKSKIVHILHNLDYYYIGRIKLDETEINKLKCYFSLHNIPLEYICENNDGIYLNFTKVCFFFIDNWASVSDKYIKELIKKDYYKDLIKIINFKPYLINNGINKKYFLDYIKINLENKSKFEVKKYLFDKYFKIKNVLKSYKMFGFIGRIVEQKGVFELLLGIKEFLINKISKNCFFIIAGKGDRFSDYVQNIKKLVLDLNIENFKIWTEPENFFEEKIELLYGCDFIIIPSLFEPCGIVQQEAFACSTPVLASNTGGLSDTIDNLKNGIFFENLTPIEISNKLEKCYHIIENKLIYEKMCHNAYNKCLTIKKTGKKWWKQLYLCCNLININDRIKAFNFKENIKKNNQNLNLFYNILDKISYHQMNKNKKIKKIKFDVKEIYNPFLSNQHYFIKFSFDNWRKKHKLIFDKDNQIYYIKIPINEKLIRFKIYNGKWIILKNYSLEFDQIQNLNNIIL